MAAAAGRTTSSAGECGVKDQVSRSGSIAQATASAREIAILGPTASGKTALASALAALDPMIELVSVDAFACYRRLDIGTAKPDPAARASAPWHLLDLVDPTEEYSVADFAGAARAVREQIAQRRRRAVFVGGSGLYLRAVVDGLDPPGRYPEVAAALEARAELTGGLERLYAELASLDPLAATRMEPTNRRRVVRALEVTLGSGSPFSSFGPGLDVYPPSEILLVGLEFARDELDRRIEARFATQLEAGFLDEVRDLRHSATVLSRTAAQAIGYRELALVDAGSLSMEEARAEVLRRTRTLARRQIAWLRRDPRIVWVDGARPDLVDHVWSMALEQSAIGAP